MSEHLAITVQSQGKSAPAKVVPGGEPFGHMRKLYNTIARRAFEIFDGRGRKHGFDFDDWIKAESEFLHPLHLDIAESNDAVTVRAEVPGFSATDLKVRVDGHLLTISGKRESSDQQKTKKTIYMERCSNQIFRSIDLPPEADTTKTQATLKDGVLELAMPKAGKKQTLPKEEGRA